MTMSDAARRFDNAIQKLIDSGLSCEAVDDYFRYMEEESRRDGVTQ